MAVTGVLKHSRSGEMLIYAVLEVMPGEGGCTWRSLIIDHSHKRMNALTYRASMEIPFLRILESKQEDGEKEEEEEEEARETLDM